MTRLSDQDAIYSREELEQMIAQMKATSSMFYAAATRIGNHAFIEFCGLMNEYIACCQRTLAAGRDFTQANTHTGQPLEFAGHNVNYLLEKLDCIYGPTLAALLKENLLGEQKTKKKAP